MTIDRLYLIGPWLSHTDFKATIITFDIAYNQVIPRFNSTYGWVKAGQKSGFGEHYFSVDFSRTEHMKVAEVYGLKAWRVEDPADLESTLSAAIAHDGPTLVDIINQPLQDAAAPVSEWVA